MRSQTKNYFLILILVLFDQLIKITIKTNFFYETFLLIPGVFHFEPVINYNLSWFGHYWELFTIPAFLYLINVFGIFVYTAGYRFYLGQMKEPHLIPRLIYLLGLAGMICSFIDKAFWGGSLDYILIPHLLTFDLKDCYINLSVIPFICLWIKYRPDISLSEFFSFSFRKRTAR